MIAILVSMLCPAILLIYYIWYLVDCYRETRKNIAIDKAETEKVKKEYELEECKLSIAKLEELLAVQTLDEIIAHAEAKVVMQAEEDAKYFKKKPYSYSYTTERPHTYTDPVLIDLRTLSELQ